MIDISIYFDGCPVGFITVPNGSLRADFEEALNYDASDEIAELSAQLQNEEDLHRRMNDALRYAEEDPEPDWQKLIEILS